jgi:hypothetical protein
MGGVMCGGALINNSAKTAAGVLPDRQPLLRATRDLVFQFNHEPDLRRGAQPQT